MKQRWILGIGSLIVAAFFLGQAEATAAQARSAAVTAADDGDFCSSPTTQEDGLVEVCRNTTEGTLSNSSSCPQSTTGYVYRLEPGAIMTFAPYYLNQPYFAICSAVDTEATAASFTAGSLAEKVFDKYGGQAFGLASLESNIEERADDVGSLSQSSSETNWQAEVSDGLNGYNSCKSVATTVFAEESTQKEAKTLQKVSIGELDLSSKNLAKLAQAADEGGSALNHIMNSPLFKVLEDH